MLCYLKDICLLKKHLAHLPTHWDGKSCVLELKEADYNWRQMEWWAFYFEYKCMQMLKNIFEIPGEKYNNVVFDLKGKINWDFKASAIKTDNHKIILNDCSAMIDSIKEHQYHGEIIALCDVEYNDINRSFQKWHTELKGGKSKYENEREKRTAVSRYGKTKCELVEIIFVVLDEKSISDLSIMKQGRNSNGKPRPEKFMLDLEELDNFTYYSLKKFKN
ncbi:MAG: hypothetical protein KatS3mg028_0228 [Bacteroidia bacterium]|nr:MAG: hypothetical protein KatS3mg028_0228 [Bacteroidia bacterium]